MADGTAGTVEGAEEALRHVRRRPTNTAADPDILLPAHVFVGPGGRNCWGRRSNTTFAAVQYLVLLHLLCVRSLLLSGTPRHLACIAYYTRTVSMHHLAGIGVSRGGSTCCGLLDIDRYLHKVMPVVSLRLEQ